MDIKPPIANYDPNERWRIHTVEIVLQKWAYRSVYTVTVSGNCSGFAILDFAISNLYDDIESELEADENDEDDDGLRIYIILTDPEGDELETADDGREVEWLQEMVVSATIVKTESEKRED